MTLLVVPLFNITIALMILPQIKQYHMCHVNNSKINQMFKGINREGDSKLTSSSNVTDVININNVRNKHLHSTTSGYMNLSKAASLSLYI